MSSSVSGKTEIQVDLSDQDMQVIRRARKEIPGMADKTDREIVEAALEMYAEQKKNRGFLWKKAQ